MTTFFLDTDLFSRYLEGHAEIRKKAEVHREDRIGITIITKAEVLRGRIEYLLKAHDREHFLEAQRLFHKTEKRLSEIFVAELTDEAIRQWERLDKMKGVRKFGRPDLLIASVALAHDAVVVTRNLKHFRPIPSLRTENWMD